MNIRIPLILAATLAIAAPAALAGYTAGGTFVVRTEVGTLLDNGGVVCQGTNGDGIGGGCLPFPLTGGREGKNFVGVFDDVAGTAVAFQVCIDNNGDGICGGPRSPDGTCPDQIFFSHSDEGRFFNPLGPLPTTRLAGCEHNGGHNGYVVLLCQGAHEVEGGAHTHALTRGIIKSTAFGSGYGNFCGGGGSGGATGLENPAIAKAYTVE